MKHLILSLVAGLVGGVMAAPSWTTDSCAPADWQALENNVLTGVKGTFDISHQPNGYGSTDVLVLADGEVPSAAGKDWIVGIMPNSEIDWVLAGPVDLEQIRFSSAYLTDPHFSGVNISSVKVKCAGSDEWTEIPGSSSGKVAGDGSSKNIICATLLDAESGLLAKNVIALKVVFGAAVYINANYYAEIEAVRHVDSEESAPIPGVVFTVE